MKFTKREFNNFRSDVEKALRLVEEKHEVKIKAGKLKYSDLEFDINVIKIFRFRI